MPSITIKNIPEEVYDRIKLRAETNRRSINSEIIECLDQITRPRKMSPQEVIETAKRLRDSIDGFIDEQSVSKAIRKGRP
jgi:antitoxin FitA